MAHAGGEEVIPVSTNDIEECKVYDEASARQFTQPNVRVPTHSFADPNLNHDEPCPPPKYLSNQVLLKPLPVTKQDLLAGLVVNDEGCLVCTDQEALDKQKGVLGSVAKQLAVNLMKGLSISHISLPIKIFEARSSI